MKLHNVAILAFLTLAPGAYAKHPKIAMDLEGAKTGSVDVIVQFKPGKLSHAAIQASGGQAKADLSVINGVLASLPQQALTALANNPNVTYLSPNRGLRGNLDYAHSTVGADLAMQYGFDGTGIGIAIVDSGINPSFDLTYLSNSRKSRIVYTQNFSDPHGGDKYGHGTHVAGIAGGNGSNSTCAGCTATFRGIASNANLIDLRVLDQFGKGTDSTVIAAIQRAIQIRSQYNIRVINLSLGRQVFESYQLDPLCQAVEAAWKAGIVVVVSAGNEGRNNAHNTNGYGTISSPGNDPFVITVGAMRTMQSASRADDRIASYSSKGPTRFDYFVKPDLVAPGNRIIALLGSSSSLPVDYPGNQVPTAYFKPSSPKGSSSYFKLSGTSMAAPMVSGAAALMLQKNPALTPDLVKARLMRTATKPSSFPLYGSAVDPATGAVHSTRHDIFTMGAGYLDIWAALNDTSPATAGKPALSPKAVRDSSTGAVSLSILWGETVLWGDSILWGESVIWGPSAFVSGSTVLWGDSVVWNNKSAAGYSLLWGESVLWGDSTIQGEATAIAINGEN